MLAGVHVVHVFGIGWLAGALANIMLQVVKVQACVTACRAVIKFGNKAHGCFSLINGKSAVVLLQKLLRRAERAEACG